MDDLIGKNVYIHGDHPHSGRAGKAVRVENFALAGPGLVVKFDNGDECAVFKRKLIQVLKG